MTDVALSIMTIIVVILFARLGIKLFALVQMYKDEPGDDVDPSDLDDLSSLDNSKPDDDDNGYEDVDLTDIK